MTNLEKANEMLKKDPELMEKVSAEVERLLIDADELFPIVFGQREKQNVFHMGSFLSIA